MGFCCYIKERIRYLFLKLLIAANLNLTEFCLKVIDTIGKIPAPIVNILKFTWKCVCFAMKAVCYCVLLTAFLIVEIIEAILE